MHVYVCLCMFMYVCNITLAQYGRWVHAFSLACVFTKYVCRSMYIHMHVCHDLICMAACMCIYGIIYLFNTCS